MMITNMTRADLEVLIISEDTLYAMFDEARLLDGGYSMDEMIEIVTKWIEDGDECGGC